MADVLMEKETIYEEEIDLIISGKSKEEIVSYIDNKDTKNMPKSEEKEQKIDVDELLKEAKKREQKTKKTTKKTNTTTKTKAKENKETKSKTKTENKEEK